MVPDTVPVWKAILEAPFEKTARVVLAGMEKLTVLPPVENWMDGSSLATSALGMNLSVSWPVIGDECAEESTISVLGCWAGSTLAGTPEIVGVGITVDPIES